MKTFPIKILIAITTTLISCNDTNTNTLIENKTEFVNGLASSTFKVWGNCEMCKETIEGSLKIDGVIDSEWNTETKAMVVSYDTVKVSLNQIEKNIALVGYDNEKYKGDDAAYKNLPECCQYERK